MLRKKILSGNVEDIGQSISFRCVQNFKANQFSLVVEVDIDSFVNFNGFINEFSLKSHIEGVHSRVIFDLHGLPLLIHYPF